MSQPTKSTVFLGVSLAFLAGCGGSTVQPTTPQIAPTFVKQPADTTVPLGLGAVFSIETAGTQPQSYQWQRNGVDISGATATTYTLQSTSESDSGSRFDVVVSNSAGSVTSRQATLSIGARSPAAGDLRFQQVDSSLTYFGYTASSGDLIPSRSGESETNAFSFSLPTGPSCDPSTTSDMACGWFYQTFVPTTGTTNLSTAYISKSYTDLSTTLTSLLQPNTVITGMDLEPHNNSSAFSVMVQPAGLPAFTPDMVVNLQPSDLAASIAAKAASGEVVTGVSYDINGTVSYIAYRWAPDFNQYDTQVLTTTVDNGASAVQTLAASGYILTAVGGNQFDGVILVGTRVHGDSLPRPIIVEPASGTPTVLSSQGYATVALFYNASQHVAWVGER